MEPFYFVETTTNDGLVHQGLYYEPSKKGKRAILAVHGLTSTFYSDAPIFSLLVEAGENDGIGLASFNTRGHDLLSSARKLDSSSKTGYTHVTIGAGVEHFEESVHDIEAGITFLTQKGFSEIILLGFSTGATKVCYYTATQKDPRVVGTILVGPLNDRYVPGEDPVERTKTIQAMEEMVKAGKGDELVMNSAYFPLTPNRYLSLHRAGSAEDMFDYGDPKPSMKLFSTITTPLMVMIGEQDEYADRPVADILRVFDEHQHARNYKGVIIPKGFHGLDGVESVAAVTMIQWANSI